ncbi:MAG: polyhydroxyalkanoate synthesis repressor PhaR [Kangiellaceae bacterium]
MQRVEVATNNNSKLNSTHSSPTKSEVTKTNEVSDERIIKKYPNRRLYDTQISRYITLNDVKQLVMEHKNFQVVDAKTNEDLTRCTLMQLIAEEETNGVPILTSEILKEFVRFYGDSMQTMMSRFLEHSVKLFMEKRARLKSPLNSMLGTNKSSLMHNIAKQNMESFESQSTDENSIDFGSVEVIEEVAK